MSIAVLFIATFLFTGLDSPQSAYSKAGFYLNQTPPGRTPEPFAPTVVAAEGAVHGSIAFMPDGTEIYWVLQKGIPGECPSVMMVKRKGHEWQRPSPVEVIGPFGASEIHISPRGDRLFFESARPWPEEWGRQPGSGTREARKVWYLERLGDTWGPPQALPPAVNQDLGGVSSTTDGTLYAAGIRRIRALPEGIYADVEWLGPPLDMMKAGDAFKGGHPYVAPDESFVLFNNDWPSTVGYGVFVSFRRSDDSWTPPVNVLDRMGLQRGGSVPVLSPDQKYLFYYAAGQIYWVDAGIIEDLRAEFVR